MMGTTMRKKTTTGDWRVECRGTGSIVRGRNYQGQKAAKAGRELKRPRTMWDKALASIRSELESSGKGLTGTQKNAKGLWKKHLKIVKVHSGGL